MDHRFKDGKFAEAAQLIGVEEDLLKEEVQMLQTLLKESQREVINKIEGLSHRLRMDEEARLQQMISNKKALTAFCKCVLRK